MVLQRQVPTTASPSEKRIAELDVALSCHYGCAVAMHSIQVWWQWRGKLRTADSSYQYVVTPYNALDASNVAGTVTTTMSASPDRILVKAMLAPLYGTCTIFTLLIEEKSSLAR